MPKPVPESSANFELLPTAYIGRPDSTSALLGLLLGNQFEVGRKILESEHDESTTTNRVPHLAKGAGYS